MLRVQLFNPSIFWYSGFQYRMLPTLSLPILAAVLNNANHHCEAVDLEALGIHPDALYERFKSQPNAWPDVIGFTALTQTVRGCKDAIAAVRRAGFKGMIMVGGVHVSIYPEQGLEWGADLVVTGACEGNLVKLLESGARGIHAGETCAIEDIPIPDWAHHNPQPASYYGNMSILRPNPGITMWTRNCPYKCIFCGNVIFGGKPTQYRPPANIEAEMRDLKARGCKRIFVYDDELIGTKMPEGWMGEVADRIEPLGLSWVTQGRCSEKYVTPELLADAKRAGCRAIFWGAESFSQPVLDAMKKHITEADIWHTLRVCKSAGIENGIFTIIGNYRETEKDLAYTRDALRRAYEEGLLDYRQTTVCTALPGTELEAIQKREGTYVEPPTEGPLMVQLYNNKTCMGNDRMAYWMDEFNKTGPLGTMGEPRPKR